MSSEPTHIDSPPMTSNQCSIATMTLSRTVSETNGDFSRKSQNFPTSRVFFDPADAVRLGFGYRRKGSKQE